jgi:hypothetical protein
MPRKKVENSLESEKKDNETKLEQSSKKFKSDENDSLKTNSDNVDIEKRAEELSSKILRALYATYGARDSHANRHLYHHVIFEVARLSNKTIDEVLQKWPKFDIFSILEDIKKVIREELESDPNTMYRMFINDRIIADRILAKVISKNIT